MDPDQQLFSRQVFQAPFDDFPGNPVSFPLYDHRLETFVCHITSMDQYFPRLPRGSLHRDKVSVFPETHSARNRMILFAFRPVSP
jgi:hypothetical protein